MGYRDKALEEGRVNRAYNPERFAQIRKHAEELSVHFQELITRKRESGDTVIHFAAYVVIDAEYAMDGVFELMRKNPDRWDPKVVIIPDVSRTQLHQEQTYIRTRQYFVERYGEEYVLDGWDMETDTYQDHTDRFDIIYHATPYDAMVSEVHSIRYVSSRDVLPVYVNYGFDVAYYFMQSRLKGPALNYVWKYFTETVYSEKDIKEYQVFQGENTVLTGYAKMDAFADYPVRPAGKRKKILITPHHSVYVEELPLSNFMQYYGLIPKLKELFPDVDFVFRPHPLLFARLVLEDIWTQDQVDAYLAEIKNAGIEYSCEGDYLRQFAACDAIVNDSGSFTIEWLFTGKPGCFVYNDDLKDEHLTGQMKEAIKRYRVAHSEEDIIRFIRDVAEDHFSAEYKMDDWVRDNIAINYPHVTEKILEEMDILR